MSIFKYRALAPDYRIFTGMLEAADRAEACANLEQRGLKPVDVQMEIVATPIKRKFDSQKMMKRLSSAFGNSVNRFWSL